MTIFKNITRLAVVAALTVLGTGCDFNAAQDAFEDLGVVIELEPIHTVVSAQVIDADTGQPIRQDVTLQFGGSAGGQLVDIYNDPINEVSTRSGFATFGLSNQLVPTEGQPVKFSVAAEAEGYLSRRKAVVVADTGSATFTIRLLSDRATGVNANNAGTVQSSGATDANGATTQASVVATPSTAVSNVRASLDVPQGIVAKTSGGEVLRGQLTTALRVFDNSRGSIRALPEEVLDPEGDGAFSLAGAVSVKMTDEGGRVAASFASGAAGKGSSSRASGACTAGDGVTVSFTIPAGDLSFFQNAIDSGNSVSIYAYNPGTGAGGRVGTVDELVDGDKVVFCYGGTESDVDISATGPVTEGLIFSAGIELGTCAPQGSVSVDPNGHVGTFTIELIGAGVYYSTTRNRSEGGAFNVSYASFVSESIPDLNELSGFGYQVRVVSPEGTSATADAAPCTGSSSISAPAPAQQLVDVTVRVAPQCPAGQRVPITGKLDGLTVMYRMAGVDDEFTIIPSADIKIKTTQTAFEEASARMRAVLPNTSYELVAAFGSDSEQQTVTTPGTTGQTVNLDASMLQDECQ